MSKLSPLMEQFYREKKLYPDALLLFRVGDFYETFAEDAVVVARDLNIVLTSRQKDEEGNKIPLAGIPYHALDAYLARLIRAGHKVAISDQVEDPKLAHGLVKREITRVVTPGTIIDPAMLDEASNNFLATVVREDFLEREEGKEGDGVPSTLSAGGESAKESREQAEAPTETQTSALAGKTAAPDVEASPAQTETVNAQGNWFFALNDSMVRELAMTLLQDGGNVYGSGRIREGNSSMDVAVSGTASGRDLMLNLVSTGPIIEYKLNLTVDQDLAAGEYRASSADGETWMGTAEGQKTT